MKKLCISLLTIIMVISCAVGLLACGDTDSGANDGRVPSDSEVNDDRVSSEHEHNYVLKHTDKQHYLACTCGDKKDYANHVIIYGKCSGCDYYQVINQSPVNAVPIPGNNNSVSSVGWPLKLQGYKTNVNNATALGIASNKNSNSPYGATKKSKGVSLLSTSATTYSEDFENKNYIVKSTTNDYASNNPSLSDKGIEKITFTKTITSDVATEINGSKFIKAKQDESTIVPTLSFESVYYYIYFIYLDNELVFANITDNSELDINKQDGVISLLSVEKDKEYEIRYIAIGENESENENESEGANETEDENGSFTVVALDDIQTIKSTISFIPVQGYKYSLYLEDALVYENVEDNSSIDINSEEGVITISDLENDKNYEIRYEYTESNIVVTQEQIEGEIDKLYVLGNYTFISFVPENTSKRPSNENLTYDTDGIATYDKRGYFSNGKDRQSFIIDNSTGYVYDIKGFNIKEIQGGLLISADDNYIYDFKINENDEVEIFSLFTNDSIEWYHCFKDKYGNKYIFNNRITSYDQSTKTYFYMYDDCNYELTSNGEAIKLICHNTIDKGYRVLSHASIILANGQERNLTVSDTFKILCKTEYWERDGYQRTINFVYYKVEKGVLYGNSLSWVYNHSYEYIEDKDYFYYSSDYQQGYNWDSISLCQYDAVSDVTYYRRLIGLTHNTNYLQDYNVIVVYNNGKLYYTDNIWKNFRTTAQLIDDDYNNTGLWGYNESFGYDYYNGLIYVHPGDMTILNDPTYTSHLLIEDCSVSDDKLSILKYGINGNTYYDIVVEEINGEIVVNQYVKGTYEKPQIKIVLQPLNKK